MRKAIAILSAAFGLLAPDLSALAPQSPALPAGNAASKIQTFRTPVDIKKPSTSILQAVHALHLPPHARVARLRFAGPGGVAEYAVRPGESLETAQFNQRAQFRKMGRSLQPLTHLDVISQSDSELAARKSVQAAMGTLAVALPSYTLAAPRVESLPKRPSATSSNATVMATYPNDWPLYFPTEWEVEAAQISFCNSVVNGTCSGGTTRRDSINTLMSWGGLSHSTSKWPDSDWGLESNLSFFYDNPLIFCPPGATSCYDTDQKRWLSDQNHSWTTSIPAVARPYFDDNRAFDAVNRLAMGFGIGYPNNVGGPDGYTFQFVIVQDRPTAALQSTADRVGASFKIVSNDCNDLHREPSSDCMNLNEGRAFAPYPTKIATVVER